MFLRHILYHNFRDPGVVRATRKARPCRWHGMSVVIRFIPQNGESAINLLQQYGSDHLVSKSHPRQRDRSEGTGTEGFGKPVRTADDEDEFAGAAIPLSTQ